MGMDVIWIAVCAFLGGIVAALLGWLETQESFVARKFAASIVRALVAGIAFAVAYQFANGLSVIDLLLAFLGGAGIDAIGNRAAGAIKAGLGK